jgi:hypothetical protein
VSYVTDPFHDARQPIAALVAVEGGLMLVRALSPDLPVAARANVARVLRDLDDSVALDALPLGASAQVVGVAVPPSEAPECARRDLTDRAA